MDSGDDKRLNNHTLFDHYQRAYEYAAGLGAISGDATWLRQELWARRLEYILGLRPGELAPWANNRLTLDEILSRSLDGGEDRLITADIDEFYVSEEAGRAFLSRYREFLNEEAREDERRIVERHGLDAYASYLPIHYFFDAQPSLLSWGVVISERAILGLAARFTDALFPELGEPKTAGGFIELAYQVLLRHELYHFKVEAFALNAEMIRGEAIYAPYLENVYAGMWPGDGCLEEALANKAALYSSAAGRIFTEKLYPQWKDKAKRADWRNVLLDVYKEQPPAYQNYGLNKGPHTPLRTNGYSVHQQATNYLCNQIIRGQVEPTKDKPFDIPLYAFPPDNYFLRAENLIPIYLVRDMRGSDLFIQIQGPPKKEWQKLLKLKGCYRINDGGKGDHEKWDAPGLRRPLILDYKDGHLDYGSFKSSLETLEITKAQYRQFHLQGELPSP